MSLTLQTNLNSLTAQNSLAASGASLSKALQQLSSGLRINTAADDAAGYAIVQGMTSQINGLNQAARNASDGVSLAQTASGALSELVNDLQAMRDLAVQSLNATNSAEDRQNLNKVYQQLSADMDTVAQNTAFNGVKVLDGTFNGAVFQVGANPNETITVQSFNSARTFALGVYSGATAANIGLAAGAAGTTLASAVTVGGTTYSLNQGNPLLVDAAAVASSINSAQIAGLKVTANANNVLGASGTLTANSAGSIDTITVNGSTINLINSGNVATNVASAAAQLTQVSGATGVTAAVVGGGLQLTALDGRNITVVFGSTAGAGVGAAASLASDYGLGTPGALGTNIVGTFASNVNIDYDAPTGVSGSIAFTGALSSSLALGLTGTSIAASDVTSVATANASLVAIDQAIQQLAGTGAQLGAYQGRFQAAISGLKTTATNLSAARSSIQDTDYAAATSQLSSAQILQQASTAMVAQANMVPQNVLSLLQKLP